MNILQLLASDNYITLNKDLIKILDLDSAVLFGELVSEYIYWAKNGGLEDGYFYSTVENIEEKTTLTAFKQRQAIKLLEEKGLVEVAIKGIPAKRYIKINEEQVIKLFNSKLLNNLRTSNKIIKEQDIEKLNTNNNIINKNINNNNIKDIINYLNEKANTNYKPTTNKTIQLVNARLNEKFTIDDFKKVIDNKCEEWLGTDMERYLRPETLFGTKFEGYLNQRTRKTNMSIFEEVEYDNG